MDIRPRSIRRARTVATLCALAFTAIAAAPLAARAQDAKQDGEALYAIGVNLAKTLEASLGVTPEELETVYSGMTDYFAGKAKPDPSTVTQIQAFQQSRQSALVEREKKASGEFLVQEAKVKGAKKLESGIVYKDVSAGSGTSPKVTDTVRVTYKGTLRDGTVFDSNLDKESPAQFPLNGVIPCWQEAIARMKPGGKAEFVCPSGLAYGDAGRPGIPPGAALKFEVELIGIGAAE